MTGYEAIRAFREAEGLAADGGDAKKIDWGSMFGMPVPIPNTSWRRPLVPYHDFHHLLSGYRTDEIGEGEVSAWTIGTGGGPLFGRVYDLGALLPGLVQAPRRCLKAFYRGRRSRNLYSRPVEAWLAMDLDAIRDHVGGEGEATWRDHLALLGVAVQVLLVWGVPFGPTLVAASVLSDALGLSRATPAPAA